MWYFIILPPSHVVHQLLSTHWVSVSENTRIQDWTIWHLFSKLPINWERIVQEIDFLSPERSSREGWESKSKDGANVSFQWGCQDPFLVAVDRLVHESEGNKPIYNLQTFNLAVFYNELKHFFVQGNPNACWWSQNSYIPVPLTSASSPKKTRSEISILDSHYHPTTRRDW